MIVYLMRHGQAAGGPDDSRELTAEGARQVEIVAGYAADRGVHPELVVSSTYARAIQTAEIAARVLGCERPVERTPALLPNASPEAAWEEIRARAEEGDILTAGHMPLIADLAALLIGAPGLRIRVVPATLLAIEVERPARRPSGILLWMIAPPEQPARVG
jgi:phosphohistidine phosphatase